MVDGKLRHLEVTHKTKLGGTKIKSRDDSHLYIVHYIPWKNKYLIKIKFNHFSCAKRGYDKEWENINDVYDNRKEAVEEIIERLKEVM